MDAQRLVAEHSPLLLGNRYARVEAAPKLTPGDDQDGSQGERRSCLTAALHQVGKTRIIRKTCLG